MEKNSPFNINQELTDEQKKNINYFDLTLSFISGFLLWFSFYYTAKCTCSTNLKEFVALGFIFTVHTLFILVIVLMKLFRNIKNNPPKSILIFLIALIVFAYVLFPVTHWLPESIIPTAPPWAWAFVLLIYFLIFIIAEYKKNWGYIHIIGAKKYFTIFILPITGFLFAIFMGETQFVKQNFSNTFCESFDCKSMCNEKLNPTCYKHLQDNTEQFNQTQVSK